MHASTFGTGVGDELTSVYSRSQTSWVWLETKLVELGMLGGVRNYRVSVMQAQRVSLSAAHGPIYR